MVAAAKTNLGKMPCPCCGGPVAVMKAATGTLSFKCQEAECEATGFAAAHTAAARKWLAALPPPKAPAEPAPAPATPAPAAKPARPVAPAPKDETPKPPPKKATPFDFLTSGA